MNCLIVGCGYVGSALAQKLSETGYSVTVLTRDSTPSGDFTKKVEADLCDPDSLSVLAGTNYDCVFYTAGASGYSASAYRDIYVDGLKNLMRFFAQQKSIPSRFIFTSSTGVYAQNDGEVVDELSETTPDNFSGKIMLEAESLLTSFPCQTIAVRFGGIYGPGRTRMIQQVREGTISISESDDCFTNRIHRDDCAGVLQHLLELKDPESIYVAVDCEPALRSTVIEWLASTMDVDIEEEEFEKSVRSRGGNKRCSNKRLLASGYTFQYPNFRVGYTSLL